MPNSAAENIYSTKPKMRNKSNKFISCFLSLIILLFNVLPVFADTETGKVLVTIVCKLEDRSSVDDYSVVVVTLLNRTSGTTEDYKLYEYNNFSEKFLMDKGDYSILYAKIDNRNDIIFDVISEPSFEIGNNNAIYFELVDSNAISRPTTTKPTATDKTAPYIYTLFDLTNKDNSVTNKTTDNINNTSENRDNTGTSDEISNTADTDISGNNTDVTPGNTENTNIYSTTVPGTSVEIDSGAKEIAKRSIIAVAVFIGLIIFAAVVLLIIKVRNK